MNLEELAASVKAGEPGTMLELWEAVRRFVEMKAWDRARAGSRVPYEDLTQAGFLAVIDAAEQYVPGKENASFLSLLSFTLRTRWAEEAGTRTTRRDALRYADSLDAPTVAGEEDSTPAADFIVDEDAALAFSVVEYRDFVRYSRRLIAAALDTLPPEQGAILRLHYLEGRSLEDAAALCGLSCKQTASDTEFRALLRLERGKYRRELRDCLDELADYEAARLECYDSNINRRTEAAALLHIEGGNTVRTNTPSQEELEQAVAFLRELQEIGPEGRKNRITALHALSELAREYPAARLYLEKLLEAVKDTLPEECQTYRALFLDGEAKQTARQVARRLCMDVSTVNRHTRRILRAMLPLAFGIGGVFKTSPGTARDGPGAAAEAGEG